MLVAKGANVNAVNIDNSSALIFAAAKGNTSIDHFKFAELPKIEWQVSGFGHNMMRRFQN